ncbi:MULTISPECIES: hypothetical protein [Bacillaceae]|uniref:hypothetical protein n=1 Tax=Bacillaceae TaxID=186817 RepID=UPI000AA14EB6|nr:MULTISPECIES: hypothetical protein [Bacillaceae]UOE95156.1 hypothetical protein MM271_05895 [Alkalihalobacillus sp. LMS39]
MKRGIVLLFIGLFMLLLGIYLSVHWVLIGTLLGVSGGILMGSSSYFLAKKKI